MSIVTTVTEYAKTHWKRALYSVGAAGLSFGVLEAVQGLLSVTAVTGIAAVAVGVLVYVKVADWEFKRAIDTIARLKTQAEAEVSKLPKL